MMRTPLNKAIKSKGMLAGFFMVGLGVYIIVEQQDPTGGLATIGVGFGIMGIRDAQ